ncbi:MAG: leucine-rich repeat domain-containing protein [Abditibacteriota bacterium]|nr:leucine-rich repeat domain-containing protein [Abditibacteriota bacterium]
MTNNETSDFRLLREDGVLTGYEGECPEDLDVPEGVTEIGDGAFAGCGFYEVSLPESLRKIGKGAFEDCCFLHETVIPEGVAEIGERAFAGCSNLKTAILPKSVKTVGKSAFDGCIWLDKAIIYGRETEIGERAFADAVALRIDCGVLTGHEGESPSFLEIPEGVTEIGAGAFAGCVWLEEAVFPESLSIIGDGAFAGCIRLERAEQPYRSRENGKRARSGELLLSENIREICSDAFAGCRLSSISGIASKETVASDAFRGDTVFWIENGTLMGRFGDDPEVPVIPLGITGIMDGAFRECAKLTEICVPAGVRVIGADAFRGCPKLKKAVLPEGLDTIDDRAFADCPSLEEMDIPGSVKLLGISAFRNVPAVPFELQIKDGKLTGYNGPCPDRVEIPEGVTEIEREAFGNFDSDEACGPKEIAIPKSVTKIGDGAFSFCEDITIVSQNPAAKEFAEKEGIPVKDR